MTESSEPGQGPGERRRTREEARASLRYVGGTMARKVLQHRNNTPARWWKWSRLAEIPLRNARVAQKITNGCGPTSRTRRPTLMVRSVFLNWRRTRWTACFIAITIIVDPAQSQQTKPAEPNVAARVVKKLERL